MSTLHVPGAELFYQASGQGPLLLLIPGAGGDSNAFHDIVPLIAGHYRVVIYDRRGFSRSKLVSAQDYDHRLDSDVDDARRLITQMGNEPAFVFGNSSGAIVGLELLRQSPELIQRMVAHEPPLFNLTPDGAGWLQFFDQVYETYRQEGVPKAMHQFASGTNSLDHRLQQRFMQGPDREVFLTNAGYWMEHELRQYPRVDIDLAELAEHRGQITLAGGRDSRELMTYQPNKVLAQKLDLNIVEFPGGHLGFLAYPDEFAQRLLEVFAGDLAANQAGD